MLTKKYISACWYYFYPDVIITFFSIIIVYEFVPQRIGIKYLLMELAIGKAKNFLRE